MSAKNRLPWEMYGYSCMGAGEAHRAGEATTVLALGNVASSPILAVLGARKLAPARGSGWLRSLGCPRLRAAVTTSRGRWAEDATGGAPSSGWGDAKRS
ncbi:MAG: hypothetical protein ACREXY_17635 [Gammaproteobacteria bacterium]